MRKKINEMRILRINKSCAYFPCHKTEGGGLASNSQSHKGLEDCTFCYCPFYPCKDQARGKFIFTKNKKKIWSCLDCSWIHKKKVVDNILKLVRLSNINPRKSNHKLKTKNTGIIILGHGSKLKKANNALCEVVKKIKQHGFEVVEPAYLQLHQPVLHKSVRKIIAKGCQNIIIVPFFLFMGNHVKRDVPKIIMKEKKFYPGVNFIYTKNIGSDSRITDIALDCIREVCNARSEKSKAD